MKWREPDPCSSQSEADGSRDSSPLWVANGTGAVAVQLGPLQEQRRGLVLGFGDPASAWAEAVRAALEPIGGVLVTDRLDVVRDLGARAEVCLLHGACADPVRVMAELWGEAPHLSIILNGGELPAESRAAAYEAGVACITEAVPDPQELRAVVRLSVEQNRSGSPELLRSLCHAVGALSASAVTGSESTFVDVAVREVARIFNAEKVSIQLREPTGELQVRGSVGLPFDAYERPRASGIADAVAVSAQARIILRELPRDEPASGKRISAAICVPLIEQQVGDRRVRGVINIARTRPCSVFTPRDLEVATTIAGMIAEGLGGIEARSRAAETMRRLAVAEKLMTVGELAAGVAHEVANPLACVRANTETLAGYLAELVPVLRGIPLTPQLVEVLDDLPAVLAEIGEGIARAEDVVRQMKSLVRLDDSTPRDNAVVFACVVRSTVRLLRGRVPNPRLRMDEGAVLRGSPAELSQVMVNLLANAADACAERTAASDGKAYQPLIDVEVKRHGDEVQVVVSDNGAGMDDETAARVFMPLFTTKSAEHGTGLGLPIVRRLVERHGGVIRVASQKGLGTVFTITLPALSAALPQAENPPLQGERTPVDPSSLH